MTADDYFQDISPSDDRAPRRQPRPVEQEDAHDDTDSNDVPINVADAPSRGIRNIAPPRPMGQRPTRLRSDARPPARPRKRIPIFVWVAGALVLIVAAVSAILGTRPTSVIVTPKSHSLTLDGSSQITAYPSDSTSTGALTYTVKTFSIEDTEVVQAQGTEHAETKASGSITVFNDTASPMKLVKTTRFETPDGLIFRAPSDVSVPAKKSVTVTVIADKAGDAYNIGPVSRFTLPGLKSSADLYAHVYAKSDAAMSGGFSGDRPAAAPGALDAALAAVRGRLEEKARTTGAGDSGMTISGLMRVTYTDLPPTEEAGGGVRIHERADIQVPVFDAGALAAAVAQTAALDVGNGVSVRAGDNFTAQASNPTASLGIDPLVFSLTGNATLVWDIDTIALANALAGKEQDAFQTIVNGFSGIQEAHARIEPFWKKQFPARASDIKVTVNKPAGAPAQ